MSSQLLRLFAASSCPRGRPLSFLPASEEGGTKMLLLRREREAAFEFLGVFTSDVAFCGGPGLRIEHRFTTEVRRLQNHAYQHLEHIFRRISSKDRISHTTFTSPDVSMYSSLSHAMNKNRQIAFTRQWATFLTPPCAYTDKLYHADPDQ